MSGKVDLSVRVHLDSEVGVDVLDALFMVVEKAAPILVWDPSKAEAALPGLQAALTKFHEARATRNEERKSVRPEIEQAADAARRVHQLEKIEEAARQVVSCRTDSSIDALEAALEDKS